MEIKEIMPGVKLCFNSEDSIMFGCPVEIIKYIIQSRHPFPDTIVLPDTTSYEGNLQTSTEFPLYYFLFVLGNYFKGKKLTIIADEDELKRNRDILRLTLLGPTKEEYLSIGKSDYFDGLYRESRELAIKDKAGNECTIDDFINFIPFKNYLAETDRFIVEHTGKDKYTLNKKPVELNFEGKQVPPYDLNSNNVPLYPGKFGIDILGGGSGFTPHLPTSGALLNYYSNYMLLDCVPYLEYSLSCRGVSRQQIKSIFLSHIHDDHCNIYPLLHFNNKIKFLATKEIYWMAMKKLSLATGYPIDSFYSYFDFVELIPYEKNEFYGMTIQPHYTVHSIPTTGATFRMKEQCDERSIVFIGDNKAVSDINKLVAKGVVNSKKAEYLHRLYTEHHDLILPDGGMGILHGDPRDSLKSTSDRVVFLHLENLPKEFDATFSTAKAGKRYNIIENIGHSLDAFLIKTIQIFQEHFPNISQEWLSAIMNSLTIENFNPDDIILKQNDPSKGVIFVILSGICSIKHHDGNELKEIALKESGEFIGEMSIVMQQTTRSASVIAKTPVTLGVIDEQLFYSFINAENRIEDMKKMWSVRRELEKHYPFNQLTDTVNDKIAKNAELLTINNTAVISTNENDEQYIYLIIEGEFIKLHHSSAAQQILLRSGDSTGYKPSPSKAPVEYKALTDGTVIKLSASVFNEICSITPKLKTLIE